MLRILEDKGHLAHAQQGIRHVYFPTVARDDIRDSAMRHVLRTFFAGSTAAAMAALLQREASFLAGMPRRDRDRLADLLRSLVRPFEQPS